MENEVSVCPICGGRAVVYTDIHACFYEWTHRCTIPGKSVIINGGNSFATIQEAMNNWGEYCSMIQTQLDFEYGHGYADGMRDS